jgi:hypothetical protein
MSDTTWDGASRVTIVEPLIIPPHLAHLAPLIREAVGAGWPVIVAAPPDDVCPQCGQHGIEVTTPRDVSRRWVHGPNSIGLPPCPQDGWERRA